MINDIYFKDFPVGPVTKISHFHCGGASSIPLWEAKIPHAMQHGRKISVLLFLKICIYIHIYIYMDISAMKRMGVLIHTTVDVCGEP